MKKIDGRLPTPSQAVQRFFGLIDERLRQLGFDVAGSMRGNIASGYVSGNPTLELAFEDAASAGAKTHKVEAPITNRFGALAADDVVAVHTDRGGNRWPGGKLIDVSEIDTDADRLMGVRPIAPGNTLLGSLTLNNEQTTTSGTFVTVKRVFIGIPGAARIKGQLSRAGGTARARVAIELPDGTLIPASADQTYVGTVHPTYGAQFSLDMNQVIGLSGAFIHIQLMNDSAGIAAYIKNVTFNYVDATATISPYSAVITD